MTFIPVSRLAGTGIEYVNPDVLEQAVDDWLSLRLYVQGKNFRIKGTDTKKNHIAPYNAELKRRGVTWEQLHQLVAKEKEMGQKNERPVLVTTSYRGVFFGYASETDGETIKLRGARNCVYWPTTQKGFLGLASSGPLRGARVGPPADIELRSVTCVAEVSPEAVKRWEEQPWS
jgi:hypothetical protein